MLMHDITSWDKNTELFKVSFWGKLIHGVTNSTYPPNYGWTFKFDRSKEILSLSDLTISRLTTYESQHKSKPPNCIQNWKRYTTLKVENFFKHIGTPFTNPVDENTWLVGLLHRDLFVRSKDPANKHLKCRLCNQAKESIDHFTFYCKKVNKVKK